MHVNLAKQDCKRLSKTSTHKRAVELRSSGFCEPPCRYCKYKLTKAKKKIAATVDFVDIAGLIKGASKGEGLGNQFLANIRETSVIAHVVRCFDNPDIQHVREDAKTDASIDPESDILTINYELCQADIDTITKREDKVTRQIRSLGKAASRRDASATPGRSIP